MRIKNKVIIVTGASSGIGLATAKILTNKGAKVALVARSKDKLDELAIELSNSLSVPTDMNNASQIKKMVQTVLSHYGRIDVLVNNAGQGYDSSIESTNIDTFQKVSNLDLLAPLIAMQQVVPIMKKQGEGSILNISSGTALMHLPNMGAYAAIKAALAHLSLTAREELKRFNINVSVIYPYITSTEFEKNTIKGSVIDESSRNESKSSYKLPEADSAEFIAQKIIDCIENNQAEVFAHDWMKK
jgi:short-subunit dehydrogenase